MRNGFKSSLVSVLKGTTGTRAVAMIISFLSMAQGVSSLAAPFADRADCPRLGPLRPRLLVPYRASATLRLREQRCADDCTPDRAFRRLRSRNCYRNFGNDAEPAAPGQTTARLRPRCRERLQKRRFAGDGDRIPGVHQWQGEVQVFGRQRVGMQPDRR